MRDLPSLVMIILLGSVMVAMGTMVLTGAVNAVKGVLGRRNLLKRELKRDWWSGFERDFRDYADGRGPYRARESRR